jgi:hypothetical protein
VAFDYHLEPTGRAFDREQLAEMRAWLETTSSMLAYPLGADLWMLFRDASDREAHVRGEQVEPVMHALRATVWLAPERLTLSAVQEPRSDAELYAFVRFCLSRWPCSLSDPAGEVEPEVLIDPALYG